jgi:hypothetical protein
MSKRIVTVKSVTNVDLQSLQNSAGAAGDILMAAIAELARTGKFDRDDSSSRCAAAMTSTHSFEQHDQARGTQTQFTCSKISICVCQNINGCDEPCNRRHASHLVGLQCGPIGADFERRGSLQSVSEAPRASGSLRTLWSL